MLHNLPRREFLTKGGAALSAIATLAYARFARAFPSRPDEVVVPWLDQPDSFEDPTVRQQLVWEDLNSWITPNDKFFGVMHYEWPEVDAAAWRLAIDGLVERPISLTLAEVRERPREEVVFTLECSGNHGFPFFTGGIGTARWAGTPLAALLEEAGVKENAIEVVFWGADVGEIALKDAIRDVKMRQNFARSMSIAEAMNPNNLLVYEMNDAELPATNGFPLRLIAPGWYGIASVKWLTRIELRDRRFMSQMMGRDYVTIREEDHAGQTVWAETSVGPSRLKSAPARVTRSDDGYRIVGAAWGVPIARVEVRIDDGPWTEAAIDTTDEAEFAWKIWSVDWTDASPGEHTVTSRAVDAAGNVQPAMDDPWIARKHTYWESNGQVTRRIAIT